MEKKCVVTLAVGNNFNREKMFTEGGASLIALQTTQPM